jgi:hypothetical protein
MSTGLVWLRPGSIHRLHFSHRRTAEGLVRLGLSHLTQNIRNHGTFRARLLRAEEIMNGARAMEATEAMKTWSSERVQCSKAQSLQPHWTIITWGRTKPTLSGWYTTKTQERPLGDGRLRRPFYSLLTSPLCKAMTQVDKAEDVSSAKAFLAQIRHILRLQNLLEEAE